MHIKKYKHLLNIAILLEAKNYLSRFEKKIKNKNLQELSRT